MKRIVSICVAILLLISISSPHSFAAEKKAQDETQYRLKAEQVADTNRESLERVMKDLEKANNSVQTLYKELESMKNMLIKCGDAVALKEWLSSELKGGII